MWLTINAPSDAAADVARAGASIAETLSDTGLTASDVVLNSVSYVVRGGLLIPGGAVHVDSPLTHRCP